MCCKKKEPEVREDVIQYVNEEVSGIIKAKARLQGIKECGAKEEEQEGRGGE